VGTDAWIASWNTPAVTGNPEAAYVLTCSPTNGGVSVSTDAYPAGSTDGQVTGLLPGTSYDCTVVAENSVGSAVSSPPVRIMTIMDFPDNHSPAAESPPVEPESPPSWSPGTPPSSPVKSPPPPPAPKKCKWNGDYTVYVNTPAGSGCKPNTMLAYNDGSATLCATRDVFLLGPSQAKPTTVQWTLDATAPANTSTIDVANRGCTKSTDSAVALGTDGSLIALVTSSAAPKWRIMPVSDKDCSTVYLVNTELAGQKKAAYLSALHSAACTGDQGLFFAGKGQGDALQTWRLA